MKTPEQIKTLYNETEEVLAIRQAEVEAAEKLLEKLEAEWLRQHKCSCELIGVPCSH